MSMICEICGGKDNHESECPNRVFPPWKHQDSVDCWCHPTVEKYPHGMVVIHNKPTEC